MDQTETGEQLLLHSELPLCPPTHTTIRGTYTKYRTPLVADVSILARCPHLRVYKLCSWGKKRVHISEVPSFQGLNCVQELFLGKRESVHLHFRVCMLVSFTREVSLFQRTQELFLGTEGVSLLIKEVSSFQGCP